MLKNQIKCNTIVIKKVFTKNNIINKIIIGGDKVDYIKKTKIDERNQSKRISTKLKYF